MITSGAGLGDTAAGGSGSRWRTSPDRLARLLVGLVVFGAGDAALVRSALGNTPWTVFAEGVSRHSPMTIGTSTIVIGAVLLLAWIPLGERPGLGTVLNVVVIGVALDVTLLVLDTPAALGGRLALLLSGVALIGIGSGLYLGTALGPGPRDGLMTGLHRRTGLPVAAVRVGIELTALGSGWLLGGTVGVGTVAFALLIGPSVQLGIALDEWLWRRAAAPRRLTAP